VLPETGATVAARPAIVAVGVAIASLATDLVYAVLDPRVSIA
jgi:ABC-type dipeptide/oligopeptide/nickel transport system permease component